MKKLSRCSLVSAFLPLLFIGGMARAQQRRRSDEAVESPTAPVSSALQIARAHHTANLLGNGQVLVTGGAGTNGVPLTSTEIYDPATGMWSGGPPMNVARTLHTATSLGTDVVVIGGTGVGGTSLNTEETYTGGGWTPVTTLAAARSGHATVALTSGPDLLVAGGDSPTGRATYQTRTGNIWTVPVNVDSNRFGAVGLSLTALPNGEAVLAGGGLSPVVNSWNRFVQGAIPPWSATQSFFVPGAPAFYNHTATTLATGKVLAAGGTGSGGTAINSALVFDPSTNPGSWSATNPMGTARTGHTAVLLPSGLVYVAGGTDSGGTILNSAELYNPAAGTWTPTTPLATARTAHTATYLGNSQVLLVGGTGTSGALASSEIYTDPFPALALEQPVGMPISNGASTILPTTVVGQGQSLTFTIRNTGAPNLTGLAVSFDGTNASDYTVTQGPVSPVSSGNTTTFTIRFLPTGGVTSVRMATLHLASNAGPAFNPFTLEASGQALSFTSFTGGDAMNDAAKFLLAPLGFDWTQNQNELVNLYYSNSYAAGLYTTAQIQALNVGVPLIQRDPSTGRFILTLTLQKTSSLNQTFSTLPFDLAGASTVIDGQGRLVFSFLVPGNEQFFRLQAQ